MRRGAVALVGLGLAVSLASCEGGDTTEPAPPTGTVSSTTASSTTLATATTTIPATTTLPPGVMPPVALPRFPGQEELAEAWARWESQGPEDYWYAIGGGTEWMEQGSYTVFVAGDRYSVVAIEPPPPQEWPQTIWAPGPMERIFELIESMPTQYLTVEYDPTLGYPTSVCYDGQWIDDEWRFEISDLQPYTEGLPPQNLEVAMSSLQWYRYRHVDLIVEVTVGTPQRFVESLNSNGWMAEVSDPTVHYIHRPKWGPSDPFEVLDRAKGGPRILRGHEGERLILMLTRNRDEDWEVMWAAHNTEHGLRFVGPETEFSTINLDFPYLCLPHRPDSVVRNPDAELALLVRWAEGLHSLSPADDWSTALRVACAGEQT